MKKMVNITIGALIFAAGFAIFRHTSRPKTIIVLPTSTPTTSKRSDESIGKRISFHDVHYAYRFIHIPRGTKIRLVENFSKQQSSQTIVQNNGCAVAINAGYYTDTHLPLGKWNNGTTALESPGDIRLINSFVSADETGRMIAITSEEPQLYGWYFQTGPQLYLAGEPLPLSIANDEYARRSVLISLADNSTVFLSLFEESSILSGPLLSEVPGILLDLSKQESWEIESATNLDGGRASFFWDGTRMIDEITTVGSAMCAIAE